MKVFMPIRERTSNRIQNHWKLIFLTFISYESTNSLIGDRVRRISRESLLIERVLHCLMWYILGTHFTGGKRSHIPRPLGFGNTSEGGKDGKLCQVCSLCNSSAAVDVQMLTNEGFFSFECSRVRVRL